MPRALAGAAPTGLVLRLARRGQLQCALYNEDLCSNFFPILLKDKILSHFQEIFRNISVFLKANGNAR